MTMAPAWHNNPELKAEVVERLRADSRDPSDIGEILAPTGGGDEETGLGSLLEVMMPGIDWEECWDLWSEGADHTGIPEGVLGWADLLYEELRYPYRDPEWATRFAAAVTVGADLSRVPDRMRLDALTHPVYGVLAQCDPALAHHAPVTRAAELLSRRIAGEAVAEEEWEAAADAAIRASNELRMANEVMQLRKGGLDAADVAYLAAAYAAAGAAIFVTMGGRDGNVAAAGATAYVAANRGAYAALHSRAPGNLGALRRHEWLGWAAERLVELVREAPVRQTEI